MIVTGTKWTGTRVRIGILRALCEHGFTVLTLIGTSIRGRNGGQKREGEREFELHFSRHVSQYTTLWEGGKEREILICISVLI